MSGQVDCVKFLLELGVMHSPRDINNCTPLDYGNQANKPDCIKGLLKVGAEYGVTQSPAKHGNGEGKDGSSSRKNSLQGTRKKRFGFLSDIFSRTRNGLRSKQSSVESNEDHAAMESNENMEMKSQQCLSHAKDAELGDVCGVFTTDNAKSNGSSGEESNNVYSNNNSHSHIRDTDRLLVEKQTVPKTSSSHCYGDNSTLESATSGFNCSPMSTQRSLSLESDGGQCESKNSIPRNHASKNGRWRKRSLSIPSEERKVSPVPDRIPPFTHHSLLPCAGASTSSVKSSPLVCDTASAATYSRNYSSPAIATGGGSGGMSSPGEAEPFVGLKPLCRELPDANTVQRHAQEILEAQRGKEGCLGSKGWDGGEEDGCGTLLTFNSRSYNY